MVCGASVWNGRYLQNLCGEFPRDGPSAAHPGGSTNDCQRRAGKTETPIMKKQTSAGEPISIPSTANVEGFDSLAELALDLRWSWNHANDDVWRQLEPALWDLTQ